MFKRLLKDEEERKMEFTEGIAIEIKEHEISQRIKEKHEIIPRYLKRIKKECIQSADSPIQKIYLLKSVTENKNSISSNDLKEDEVIVKIPAFEPITKEQFQDANNVWPSHFYNHITEDIDQKSINEKLSIFFDRFVDYLIKQSNTVEFCSSICMIFDENKLISTEFDEDFIIKHAIITSIRSVSMSKRGYLCTGYTAFLFQEPCLSCAMALVHGRIKNVFILRRLNEGSFSKYKLNYNRFLNHRFNVYFYDFN